MSLSSHNALKKAKKSLLFGVIFRLLEESAWSWFTPSLSVISADRVTESCTLWCWAWLCNFIIWKSTESDIAQFSWCEHS